MFSSLARTWFNSCIVMSQVINTSLIEASSRTLCPNTEFIGYWPHVPGGSVNDEASTVRAAPFGQTFSVRSAGLHQVVPQYQLTAVRITRKCSVCFCFIFLTVLLKHEPLS